MSLWTLSMVRSLGPLCRGTSFRVKNHILSNTLNSSSLPYFNKECLAISWCCYSSALRQIENSVIAKCYNCKNIPEDLHHISG